MTIPGYNYGSSRDIILIDGTAYIRFEEHQRVVEDARLQIAGVVYSLTNTGEPVLDARRSIDVLINAVVDIARGGGMHSRNWIAYELTRAAQQIRRKDNELDGTDRE